jgi:hypothetical protein
VEAGTAGVGFGGLHEGVGKVQPAEGRADVEALDLGGMGDLRQRAEHDASGGRGIDGGDPDGRVGRCEVVLESSAVVAHENADGFVIFLDEGEGGIGMEGGGAVDGDWGGRIHGLGGSPSIRITPMSSQKWKLGTLRAGQDVAWSYETSYARQVVGGVERLVIAPGAAAVGLLRELLGMLPEPLWVLYVLVTPRTEAAAGRYQSAKPHTREEVLALLERFENYFAGDGRHNLWLAAPPAGQLVFDRHEVIYAYGPIAEIVTRLKEKHFAEVEMIRVPVPHSHHFHEEMDAEERAILGHWEWVESELQETDDL